MANNTCTILYSNANDLEWLSALLKKTRENPIVRGIIIGSEPVTFDATDTVIFMIHQWGSQAFNHFHYGGDHLDTQVTRAYIESMPIHAQPDWTKQFYVIVTSDSSQKAWNTEMENTVEWLAHTQPLLQQIFDAGHLIAYGQEETVEMLGYTRK